MGAVMFATSVLRRSIRGAALGGHDPVLSAGEAAELDTRTAAPAGRRRQSALPAFHWAQVMFQPFSPLAGSTVLSPELTTSTTSPISELL